MRNVATARSVRTSTTALNIRVPPGPKGRRFAGNLSAYEADRLGFLLEARDRYGGLVKFDGLTTIVNNPALVIDVLRDRPSELQVRENFLQERHTAAQAAEMLRLRMLINPGLRPQAVASARISAAQFTRDLLLAPYLTRGNYFDPTPVLEQVISHTVADFHFGPTGAHLPAMVGALLDELGNVIGNPFALPATWRTPTRRRIRARYDDLHRAVLTLVRARARRRDSAAEGSSAPRCLVDMVLAANDLLDRAHDQSRVAGLIIGSLLAAQRVPAAAASWALKLLSDHPVYQHQIRTDTSGAYAIAAILESLRLYPATWLITRTATTPLTVGGYQFAKGHNFLISPYVLHRDIATWQEPHQFRPERWATKRPPTGTFLPFGAGLHQCPGRHLATTVIESIITTIIENAMVRRAPGHVHADPRTTLLPRGLALQLQPLNTEQAHVAPSARSVDPQQGPRFPRSSAPRVL